MSCTINGKVEKATNCDDGAEARRSHLKCNEDVNDYVKKEEHKRMPKDSRYVLITVRSGMLTFPLDVMIAAYKNGDWYNVQGDRVSEQYTGGIIQWKDFEIGEILDEPNKEGKS